MKASGIVTVTPVLPQQFRHLEDLAYNLRWVWRCETRNLFRTINPEEWDAHHDPLRVLRFTTVDRWNELAQSRKFIDEYRREYDALERYLDADSWYSDTHKPDATGQGAHDPLAAYFSMEFGITPCLPIYSGGLGVLAGDHLKSASDLGVPLIGVGLLYRYGYFRQTLSREGVQVENYTEHYPEDLPVVPVTIPEGTQLSGTIRFPGRRELHYLVWKAQVGRITLLLLDTNHPANSRDLCGLTDRLYGGDEEHRIRQEILLGVGGVRAVRAYCDLMNMPLPHIAHLNEGHAGFLGIERIRERMATGLSFDAALAEVRCASVFTTHTPVPAGIDRFDMLMVRSYLNPDEQGLSRLVPGVPVDRIMQLGVEGDPGKFNMAHMGLRLAQRANGVSELHGQVSRAMFSFLYTNFPANDVPIGSVTNGVHAPTWISQVIRPMVKRVSGNKDLAVVDQWGHIERISDEELWKSRTMLRKNLVEVARKAVRQSWLDRGACVAELGWVDDVLDPEVLTVGFARRVSTYKRLTLMLQDVERLRALVDNEDRPVQFIIAGKAHPADGGGKYLLQQFVHFADEAGIRDRVVFLPDYDIELAQAMVAGCDVWLNNPIRPQEASGTSGMKAVMNGCLTMSVSDGWWDEMADDSLGWTIPSVENVDSATRDRLESLALYDLLERKIVPLFYTRTPSGLPTDWVKRMRASLSTIAPRVSATRMVRDYVDQYYRPAQSTYLQMTEEPGASTSFVEWQRKARDNWEHVTVESLTCNFCDALDDEDTVACCSSVPVGQELSVECHISLGDLHTEDVSVEAMCGRVLDNGKLVDAVRIPLVPVSDGGFVGNIPTQLAGEMGITVRVVPRHRLLVHPAEMGLCSWAS